MVQQRMAHLDLPLQALRKNLLRKTTKCILEDYLPYEMNLPRQAKDSPYYPSHQPTRSVLCIDEKTEHRRTDISPSSHSSGSPSHICMQLFGADSRISLSSMRAIHGETTLESKAHREIITEATFKPKQLKSQLSLARNKSNDHLKRAVCQAAKNQGRRLPERAGKQPTKYQRILEEYFQQKIKEKHPPHLGVPNHRLSHALQENIHIHANKHQEQPQKSSKPPSSRISSVRVKTQMSVQPRGQSERWLSLTFSERQERTMSNRKAKEVKGLKAKEEREVKGCTFHPILTEFKPARGKNGSYAQIYMDRIRQKLR